MKLHLRQTMNVRTGFAFLALATSAAIGCNDDDNSGNGTEVGGGSSRGGGSSVGGSSAKAGSSAVTRGGSSTGTTGTGGIATGGATTRATTATGGVATSGGSSAVAGARATGGMMNMGGAGAAAGRANAGNAGRAAAGAGGASGGSVNIAGRAGAAGSSWASGGTTASAGRSSTTAGEAGAAGAATVTFTTIYDSVISARCLPCHATGGGVTVGMLDMSTRATAFTNLVGASGVPAQGTSAGSSNVTCASIANLLRVDPGNATGSLIWQKVNSKLQGTSAPCGNPMPPGSGAALTQPQVEALAAWINSGAHND